MSLTLKIIGSDNTIKAEAFGSEKVHLLYDSEYVEGDNIILSGKPGSFIVLQLDDAVSPSFAYLHGSDFSYPIPFGKTKEAYSPRAFALNRHLISVRYATEDEVNTRKNLALNPWDHHNNETLYPHVDANVETRNESTFAARNAIDGLTVSDGHGQWPYSSWGINRDPNAMLRIDFGRKVKIDEVVLYLRADFPHDAWWEQVTIIFSDSSTITVDTKKTAEGQSIKFPAKQVEWIQLQDLIKSNDPSPFPALRQIMVMGYEA